MQVERISADITLKHKPRTGTQAYNMLIASLKAEIQEKQEILSHLSQDKVKQKFIENWNPTTRSVNIYDMGHTTPYQYFTKHLHRYNEWVQNNPDKAKAEGLEELPIIPLHGLRHSCATLLNYLEVNIIEISKTLGHSTCSTTMNIYAHSFEEQQEEVATKVNEFLRLNA